MVASRHIDGVETSTVALGGSWRSDTRTTASIREPALVVMALLWQCWIRRPSLPTRSKREP
jgi:hypothetical protein